MLFEGTCLVLMSDGAKASDDAIKPATNRRMERILNLFLLVACWLLELFFIMILINKRRVAVRTTKNMFVCKKARSNHFDVRMILQMPNSCSYGRRESLRGDKEALEEGEEATDTYYHLSYHCQSQHGYFFLEKIG